MFNKCDNISNVLGQLEKIADEDSSQHVLLYAIFKVLLVIAYILVDKDKE